MKYDSLGEEFGEETSKSFSVKMVLKPW